MDILFAPFDIIHRFYTVTQTTLPTQNQKSGKKYAKKCHCVISSLLRDAAGSFSIGVKNIKMFSKIFKTVDVFILENGSKDKTRQLWEAYKFSCPPNVKVFVESPRKGDYPKTINHAITNARIKKMVKLRNNLLEIIKEKSTKVEYDKYIFVTDLDIKGSLQKEGIYDTFSRFKYNKKYDAIGCNGITWNCFYFDDYAFSKDKFNNYSQLSVPIYKGTFPVESSFSGGVFYRYDKMVNLKYKFKREGKEIICEHVTLNKQLKMAINTNMIYYIYSH